jgi:L-seryl-tRNA(Ser) seleniumtransferase
MKNFYCYCLKYFLKYKNSNFHIYEVIMLAVDINNIRNKLFSQFPKVDKLIETESVKLLIQKYPRDLVVDFIRDHLEELRIKISQMEKKKLLTFTLKQDEIVSIIQEKLIISLKPKLRRVINGAGIILNTGLGRAPLSKQAQQAIIAVTDGFSSVEIDLPSGGRGNRHNLVEDLLMKLTGAEAAAVVNNNAAATMLILNTLSLGKEAVVSRGELITIGGSFRIPDIIEKSGALMKEIGTTNHTKAWEYEKVINENTGLLLKVHTSNYKVVGFVSETSLEELMEIGKKHAVPVMHDLGSGMLFDLSQYGLPKEPVVSESIKIGADVVSFSGDKLLGGPQAGIIVGKKKYIDLIKKNQLSRALRCGKLTFAALEATLRLFFDKEILLESHPALKVMLRKKSELKEKAIELRNGLKNVLNNKGESEIIDGVSEIGGGSLATESLSTVLVNLKIGNLSPEELARKLRFNDPPIITRIMKNRVIFDLRTLFDDEIELVIQAAKSISNSDY